LSTYSTNIPGASGYAQANLLAQTAYDNAMARYKQQRSNTLLSYGYRQNAAGGYEVDPNNEYGQYQQMLKGDANQSEALDRNQAASGWGGGSGYIGAQQEDLSYARGAGRADLGQRLTGTLADIAGGEQSAAYDRDANLYQNELEAAQRAIDAGQFNPGDYTGLDDSPAAPAPAGAKAAPKRTASPAKHPGRAQLHQKLARRAQKSKAKGRRPR